MQFDHPWMSHAHLKVRSGDTRPKAPRRIQARTRIEDPRNLRDKERKADTNRREEGVFRLFSREHEHCEDQVRSEKLHRQNQHPLPFSV